MSLHNKIIKAINKGIIEGLDFSFDNNQSDNIIVKKQTAQTGQHMRNAILYAFENCKQGDPIYFDDKFGYNCLTGKKIGTCCIEKNDMCDVCFIADTDTDDKVSWYDAFNYCKSNQMRLPTVIELLVAYKQGFLHNGYEYWSGETYGDDEYGIQYARYTNSASCPSVGYISIKTELKHFVPFIDIANNNIINESVDFSFDDNDTLVDKKHTAQSSVHNTLLYDFKNCNVGDPIYVDNKLGYNKQIGKLIGYCVIPAGVVDSNPRFAYKSLLMDKSGKHKLKYRWKSGKNACKNFRKEQGDTCFYMPNNDELHKAFEYGYLNIPDNVTIWSSDYHKPYDFHSTEAFVLDVKNGIADNGECTNSKDTWLYVLPFFNPPVK